MTERFDIVILGAGPVGSTLARRLAGSPWRVALVDARGADAALGDPRALALSEGARQLLEPLGAWPREAATGIETIHVSQSRGAGSTLMDCRDYGLPALGYVVRYRDLLQRLHGALTTRGSLLPRFHHHAEVAGVQGDGLTLRVTHPGPDQQPVTETWHTRLLVHAEGTPGEEDAVRVADYRQHAVLTEVSLSPGHGRRAWERFTPDGPLAVLPLEAGASIVFTVPPERAAALMAMDDGEFLDALNRQFGQAGRFTQATPRASYPLALRWRTPLVSGREVWIGNTAQTLHPVSGQGFNLGLRDAWELGALLTHPGKPALDLASDAHLAGTLGGYARRRQLDRGGSALFTDGIVRLFSNDLPPLRVARGLGLAALDLIPPLRHFVARRMIWGARAW